MPTRRFQLIKRNEFRQTPSEEEAGIDPAFKIYQPYDIRRYGMVGPDGGSGQQDVFHLAALAAAGHPITVPAGVYTFDQRLLYDGTDGLILHGEPGAIIEKSAASQGIRVEPASVFTGTVASDQTDRTEVVVSGAAFTTDQYVDHWVQVSTFFNAKTRLQKILCTANTADTLTLRFGTGVQALTGDAVAIYPPVPIVELRNIELAGRDWTGAGLIVLYADKLVLDNFDSHGHGQDPAAESNCVTVNSCRRFHYDGGETRDGLLGMIVYNTDNARVDGHVSRNANFQATLQFKDRKSVV